MFGNFLETTINEKHRDSIKLCCQRYYTSKITSYDDLSNWDGMGFKGEALACIAELSKSVSITSRPSSDDSQTLAYSVTYDKDGHYIESSIKPVAHSKGTIVVVNGFFDAYPVRRKHFDANKERKKIVRLLNEYSLSVPYIRFHLLDTQFSSILKQATSKNDIMGSMFHLFGSDTVNEMKLIRLEPEDIEDMISNLELEVESEDPTLGIQSIILALPNGSLEDIEFSIKNSSSFLFSMINGRPVDLPILRDIAKSWRLHFDKPIKRYPIALLHLHLEPKTIDINVSSDKRQVILLYEKQIMKIIEHIIGIEYPKSTISLTPKQSPQKRSMSQSEGLSPIPFSYNETSEPSPNLLPLYSSDISPKKRGLNENSSEIIKLRKISEEMYLSSQGEVSKENILDDVQEFVPFKKSTPKRLVKNKKTSNIDQLDIESNSSYNIESLFIIGKVSTPQKAFVVRMGNSLLVANHKRMTESVIYHELMCEYSVSKHILEMPIALNFTRFRRLFNITPKDEENEDLALNCWKEFINPKNDPLFEINGYELGRNDDSEIKILAVSSLITDNPDGTLKGTACKEVFELLKSIANGSHEITRTESAKKHFLQLVREEMKSLNVEDINELKLGAIIKRIKAAPQFYKSLRCPHGKPFFSLITTLSC